MVKGLNGLYRSVRKCMYIYLRAWECMGVGVHGSLNLSQGNLIDGYLHFVNLCSALVII